MKSFFLISRMTIHLTIGVFALLVIGCNSSPSSSEKDVSINNGNTPASSLRANSNDSRSAKNTLARLAQAEQTGRLALEPIDNLPVPPGVSENTLQERPDADSAARMSFDDALRTLMRQYTAGNNHGNRNTEGDSATQAERDGDNADVAEHATDESPAVKLYIKGRSEAQDNQHYKAIITLNKARELDPDEPAILRALADSYQAMGNYVSAGRMLEQLLEVKPDDSQAILTVGLAAANQRNFEKAAAILGRRRVDHRSFNHDPAADIIADFTLSVAFRHLGYDRASITAARNALQFENELGGSTKHLARLGSIYRQRGEIMRAIGDAHCRLGEYEDAMEAYKKAASVPQADPGALHPRVIYANLKLGRVRQAQREMLAALASAENGVSDRDVQLTMYLAEHTGNNDVLRQAVRDLYETRPDDANLARATAALLDSRGARRVLHQFLQRRARNPKVVGELLNWLAKEDVTQAVAVTAQLLTDHPSMATEYFKRLRVAVGRATPAVRAVEQLTKEFDDTHLAHVRANLLLTWGGIGPAWNVVSRALEQHPNDRALLRLRIDIAGMLGESSLIDRAAEPFTDVDDARAWVNISQAHRRLAHHDAAVAAAQHAVDIERTARTLTQLAFARAGQAQAISQERAMERRSIAESALQAAEQAIQRDPQYERAYEAIAKVVGRDGVLDNTSRYQQMLQQLSEAIPDSSLHDRLRGVQAIEQRRYEQALERLLNLYESDPTETISLRLAVRVLNQLDRRDEAANLIEKQLQQRPGDPPLLEQRLQVHMWNNNVRAAIEQLKRTLENDPQNYAAQNYLLEAYRAVGDFGSALTLGEKRLKTRPAAPARQLQLAELYRSADKVEKVCEALQWLVDHPETVDLQQFMNAMRLADDLNTTIAKRNDLIVSLAEHVLEQRPDMPLSVYGTALRALARQGNLGQRFERMVQQVVRASPASQGNDSQLLVAWRDLAQSLVDIDQPEAAARLLRARLNNGRSLSEQATGFFAGFILAADAARRRPEAVQQTIALLRTLNNSDQLQTVPVLTGASNFSEALFNVSQMYMTVGYEPAVVTLLNKTLERNPQHAMAMNNLGYTLLIQGDRSERTVNLLERAYELKPDDSNILDSLGWLRYKQGWLRDDDPAFGEGPGALTLLERSVDRAPEPVPEVLDHLGDARWRAGQHDNALETWRRVIAVFESSRYREQIVQTYQLIQQRVWGLVVIDPEKAYDRDAGSILRQARAKIRAVEADEPPPIAPTFTEAAGNEQPTPRQGP